MSEQNSLIGKTITAVYLASDEGAIRFDLSDGNPIIARAEGDCCSHTWIESLDIPGILLGEVSAVEDLDLNIPDTDDGYEYIAYYGCKITTEKGSCVIDYRNSSNGYYGGSLSWNDGRFYGGVFGQNISNEEWKLVVGEPKEEST